MDPYQNAFTSYLSATVYEMNGGYNDAYIDCLAAHEIGETLEYMAAGKIHADELITKEILLEDLVEEGFEELIRHSSQHVKVLIRINE